MDGLKGIADVVEHILYEILGLLVPGGALVFAVAAVLGGAWWNMLLQFIDAHVWISLIAAYVLGYPVQAISRPVTRIFGSLVLLPFRLLLWLVGIVSKRGRHWLQVQVDWMKECLLGHHTRDSVQPAEGVDLADLGASYWATRLGLPADKQLSRSQVQNLSFSMLLVERKQLDRFRSASDLSRGVAVAVVAACVLLLYQLVIGSRILSPLAITLLIGLVIAFYGLMERATMYDRVWRTIIPAQFLCAATRDQTKPGTNNVDVPPSPPHA